MVHTPNRQLALASSWTDLDAVPDRVHLLPAGEVWGFDGRGPYRLDDAARVIQASQARIDAGQARIDYGHAAWIGADHGAGAENAGFLTGLEFIPDSTAQTRATGGRAPGLWGTVRWTETARRKLAERAFTALSPVFEHDADGRVIRVLGGGLTNKPNLPLTALATCNGGHGDGGTGAPRVALHALPSTGPATSDPDPSPDRRPSDAATAPHTTDTTPLAEQLAKIFGLPDAASEAAIVTYACQLRAAFEQADDCLAAVRKALQLSHDAAPEQIATSIQSRTSAAGALSADVAALQEQVTTLTQQRVADQVDGLIAQGRALPVERETLLAMATRMPDHFRRVLRNRPVLLPFGKSRLAGHPSAAVPSGCRGPADGATLALCSHLGITPEAFAKTQTAEPRP